jgi:peptidoglycan hydrolase-like protein with peptidoglycan-binding domain
MNAFIDIDTELDDEVRRGRRGPPAHGRPGPPTGRKPQAAPPPAALRRRGTVLGGMARPLCNCPAHGDEFVRWVQGTLNRTQGLRLPVDGVMGAATRSALRAYQQQQGLPADGIAGPDTERALLQGGTAAPVPAADSAPADTAAEDDSSAAAQELEWLGPDAGLPRPLRHAGPCGCAACRPQREPDDPEFEFLGGEWEGEVNRSSSDYIRWVQASLNRLQRSGLAEDGISGPLTRSAVRSFQSRKGLQVDGIVGPVTEAALVAAGAGQPTGGLGASPGAPVGGGTRADVVVPLPASGPGYYSYTEAAKRYGRRETITALQAIASEWTRAHPAGPRLGIGNISLQGGGPFPPHSTHQEGLNVDIRPVRNDRVESPVTWRDSGYSRTLTQELVNLIRANRVLGVSSILFNDSSVSGVTAHPKHDDHLHLSFVTPPVSTVPPPSGSPGRSSTSGKALRDRLAAIATAEWETWQRGRLNENNAAMFERLVQYWMGAGYARSEAENRARLSQGGRDPLGYWSAAFISWCVRQAGATSSQFSFAGAHSTFIAEAYQNRVQRNSKPFKAYGTSEAAPRVGDIIGYARELHVPNTVATVVRDTSGYHTDIVVAIDAAASTITVIGGNLSDSVSAGVRNISTKGYLVHADPKYFGVIAVGD